MLQTKLDSLGVKGNLYGFSLLFQKNTLYESSSTFVWHVLCFASKQCNLSDILQYHCQCTVLTQFVRGSSRGYFLKNISVLGSRIIEDDRSNVLRWSHSWCFIVSQTKTMATVVTWRRIPKGFPILFDDTASKLITSTSFGCCFLIISQCRHRTYTSS